MPWTLAASCPLPDAARRMRSWDVREVFVVDGERFCGVLTDADIIVVAIASGRPPSELTAGDCHRPDAPRLHADQALGAALADMRRHQVSRLPVVDGARLVGVVWIDDLERAAGVGSRSPQVDPTPPDLRPERRSRGANDADGPRRRCPGRPASSSSHPAAGRRGSGARPPHGCARHP